MSFIFQVNISGVGELSLWEFSGYEGYFSIYDHFIGNTTCVHLIVFSLDQPYDMQLQQCSYWLSFLQARIPPMEPLGKHLMLLFQSHNYPNCYLHSYLDLINNLQTRINSQGSVVSPVKQLK